MYDQHISSLSMSQLKPLLQPASELFARMHANEVYNSLSVAKEDGNLCWTALADETAMDASSYFSQGQRQDLALSLYLARARQLDGTFFLDEPIAHLDDLNRVAMLDIFRLLTQTEPNSRMVLTTASDSLARHFSQKFSTLASKKTVRIISLKGNPRNEVQVNSW
jgi:exonuclease SbcC